MRQGLPANEVLQILKDGDGNIWANSYKQLPAYFDDINGRFITVDKLPELERISKSLLTATLLSDGTIKFYNHLGDFTFKNKKAINNGTDHKDRLLVKGQALGIKLKAPRTHTGGIYRYLNYIYLNDKIVDSITLQSEYSFLRTHFNDNSLFFFSPENKIYKISGISIQPRTYQLDELIAPEHIAWYKFISRNLLLTSVTGNVYIYNKDNLSLLRQLQGNIKANCAYIDRFNNIWVGTLDEGLAYYDQNKIRNIHIPPDYVKPNFLSIAINKQYEIFAGNYYGQVLHVKNNQIHKYEQRDKNYQTWLRTILCLDDKVISISDRGYSINFQQKKPALINPGQKNILLKDAIALDDSTLILGTIAGLGALNVNTGYTRKLNSNNDRALSLVSDGAGFIYYIGTRGIYRYDTDKNTSAFLNLGKTSKQETISALAYAGEGMLWAGTISGSLLMFRNDTVLARIKEHASLPENITCMLVYKNRLWVGGKNGIAVLSYTYLNHRLSYTLNTISKNDGLPSNTINDLVAGKDTIYVATEKGISLIPSDFQNPEFEIAPVLTGIRINQADRPLAQDYELKSNENNITLQFAGIELGGHFKAMQYRLNEDQPWSMLEGNTLNIQLNSGSHTILVNAVDVNNKPGKNVLKLHFHIKMPFYRTIWFWTLVTLCLTASLFWWLYWIKLQKQKTIYEQQLALELQRKNITADLHDDIGATLSSLQLNSAIARQLMDADAKRAQSILQIIEDQSKNLADKIGDIIWSMKPGQDEFMTIGSRIKNFAHDILGSSSIAYKIWIAPAINKATQDISIRKNIVLIAKEALNNIAKYSQASEVYISLEVVDQQLQLIVRDNGIGFKPDTKRGNGLNNMRIRTEELKGTFSLETGINKGTAILARIPLVPEFKDKK